MNPINIIYVEHDETYGNTIKHFLEGEGYISVHIAKEPKEILKYIDLPIDLILSDVFWPDPTNADNNESFPRIADVISVVRSKNSLVPIVVLSRQKDTCIEALKYESEIYDIWSKDSGYPDFFIYRVQNLIARRQNKLCEEVLLQAVFKTCEENPQSWQANIINSFIRKYRDSSGLGDMHDQIKVLFKNLLNIIGINSDYVNDTFTSFTAVEPLDMTRKSDAWGHLRHSLSVFLSGYVLLNSRHSILPVKDIINELHLNDCNEVNQAWCLASTFHDTKIFEEHVPEIILKCAQIIRNRETSGRYNEINNQINNYKMKYSYEDYKIVNTILSYSGNGKRYDIVKKLMRSDDAVVGLDHGILAAIDLFKNTKDYKGNKSIVENATHAILLHNQCKNKLDIEMPYDFFAQLLCFIDCFQAWGRENLYENLLNGDCFQKVVLRKFELAGEKLSMTVDYLPFRYVSPTDSAIKLKEEKLKDVIRNNYDILSKMGAFYKRDGDKKYWYDINLDFKFCISGREITI